MALVPVDQIGPQTPPQMIEKRDSVPRDVLKERISSLDNKMKAILSNTSLSVEEKVNRYNSVLEDYLLFADKYYERKASQVPNKMVTYDESDEDEDEVNPTPSDNVRDRLLSTLPHLYKKHGENILDHLQHHGIKWDASGTVFNKGVEVKGSNIIDLMHYVLRRRRKNIKQPIALQEFQAILKSTDLP